MYYFQLEGGHKTKLEAVELAFPKCSVHVGYMSKLIYFYNEHLSIVCTGVKLIRLHIFGFCDN
jgi:hypothetical protein